MTAKPARLRLRAGEQRFVTLTARVAFLPRGLGAIEGRARLEVSGGGRIFVPWAVALPVQGSALIGGISLSARSFRASDRAPAVLTVQAGQVRDLAGRRQLRPVSRLDVELWRGGERLGVLARLRDVLPGTVRVRADRPRPARRDARTRRLQAARRRVAAGRGRRGGGHRLPDPLTRRWA